MRPFALAAPVLLLAVAVAVAAPPGTYSPGYVSPPNTYHYPSARDFVSPANRTTSHYFAAPQYYYLHPYANAEPYVRQQYPAAQESRPPGALAPYDIPLVPRALQEPEAPPPEPARIEVTVPAGAEIWFNGAKTRQTGERRLFVSPPLEPGERYSYEVKARWTEGGKTVERSLRVPIIAGGRERVTFQE
jgi:uncharacterized protein (TIGR03000 family)